MVRAQKKNEKFDPQERGINFFVELFKTILLALLIVLPVKMFVIQPFFVQGYSMEPTFHDGDYLIVKELGYKTTAIAAGSKKIFTVKPFEKLKRGEVVVFKNPRNQKQFFIKRIIGLPGERVVISGGRVMIYNRETPQGFILDESSYLPPGTKTVPSRNVRLKDDEYFVLGDNRVNSSDSRYWGPLKKDLIIGKVALRAWPLADFSIFK